MLTIRTFTLLLIILINVNCLEKKDDKKLLKITTFHSSQVADIGNYESIIVVNEYRTENKICKETFSIAFKSDRNIIFYKDNIIDGYYKNTCSNVMEPNIKKGEVLIKNYKNKIYLKIQVKGIRYCGYIIKKK